MHAQNNNDQGRFHRPLTALTISFAVSSIVTLQKKLNKFSFCTLFKMNLSWRVYFVTSLRYFYCYIPGQKLPENIPGLSQNQTNSQIWELEWAKTWRRFLHSRNSMLVKPLHLTSGFDGFSLWPRAQSYSVDSLITQKASKTHVDMQSFY